MSVIRHGLTWGINDDGAPFEETIEEFIQRVQKKRCDTMDARLMLLSGEARLKELLTICKDELVDSIIPEFERESGDTDHLEHLVEVIEHHIK